MQGVQKHVGKIGLRNDDVLGRLIRSRGQRREHRDTRRRSSEEKALLFVANHIERLAVSQRFHFQNTQFRRLSPAADASTSANAPIIRTNEKTMEPPATLFAVAVGFSPSTLAALASNAVAAIQQ